MSVREVIYFLLASGLGLFTFVFFIFSHEAKLKHRLWIGVHFAAGALFIAFMLGRGVGFLGAALTVAMTLVFMWMSLSSSRFCNHCSSLLFGPERPEWRGKCPSCGKPLPWKPAAQSSETER